jgi:hypothetical protein
LVCGEEGATGAYSYDAPTLRHSGTQGAPYLHWSRPRWCMERRRLHLGYRSHSDCPGCRSLWGEQDRHRRCEHHHVSAPHDRPGKPRTHRGSQRDCAVALRVARERSVVGAENARSGARRVSRRSWIAKLTLRAICDCVSFCVGIRDESLKA